MPIGAGEQFQLGRFKLSQKDGITFLYAASLTIAAIVSRFGILSNDTFPLLYNAEHLSISHSSTWYNGFFPIGYPLLLRILTMGGRNFALGCTVIVQIVLTIVYIGMAERFFRRFLNTQIYLVALSLLVLFPWIIRSVLSVTPDWAAACFVLFGLVTLEEHRPYRTIAFFGLAALFREYAIVIVLALAFISLVRRQKRLSLILLISAALPLIIQGILHIVSGHPFFATDQNFNIFKMVHGVDWTNPPKNVPSALDVILHDPAFVAAYFREFAKEWLVWLPLLLYLLSAAFQKSLRTNLSWFALTSLVYIAIVTLGGSARGDVIVLPIVIACVFTMVEQLIKKANLLILPRGYQFLSYFIILAGSAVIVLSAERTRTRVDEYDRIAEQLKVYGTTPAEVFSDDYALYFPNLQDAIPRTSGGWGVVGLPNYAAEYPILPLDSSPSFISALRKLNMKAVLLRIPPVSERMRQLITSDTNNYSLIQHFPHFDYYAVRY